MPGETRLIAARQLPVEARALSVMNTIRPLTASDVPGVADWIAAIPLWQRYHYTAARAAEGLYEALTRGDLLLTEIGRASCREGGEVSVAAVAGHTGETGVVV